MHVVSAGQGREALDSMASCGWRTSVAGAPALKFSFATGESVMWMRGDVLISLASGDVSAAALEALDAQVLGHLGPVCASLEPTAADATRSPVHPAYAQPTAVQAVTITDAGIPNVDPAAVPVLAELPSMSLPAGVSGPPVPDAVEAPVAPVVPGPQVTSAEIVVPVFDETGPGCGWAFTATKPANVTREGVEKQVADLNTAKSDELTAAQAQWKKDVQAFDDALVSFIPAATAWNEHVEATRVVHMSWANQRAALDAYEVAKRAWDDAVQVRADLIAAQESAERQWLDAQAQCDAIPDPEPIPVPEPIAPEPVVPVPAPEPVPSPSPKPAPSPSPSPSPKPSPSPSVGTVADPLVCPAPRPAVLDQAVVDPGPEPSPPVLWPNG